MISHIIYYMLHNHLIWKSGRWPFRFFVSVRWDMDINVIRLLVSNTFGLFTWQLALLLCGRRHMLWADIRKLPFTHTNMALYCTKVYIFPFQTCLYCSVMWACSLNLTYHSIVQSISPCRMFKIAMFFMRKVTYLLILSSLYLFPA